MTTLSKVLSVSVLLLMAGCSVDSNSETKSVPVAGSCSQGVIDLHNAINVHTENYKNSPSTENLMQVKRACDAFASSVGGGSCTAINTTTGQQTNVTATSQQKCAYVDHLLGLNNGNNGSIRPPNPSLQQGDVVLGQARVTITLIVRKGDVLNQLSRDERSVLQAGVVIDAGRGLRNQIGSCSVEMNNTYQVYDRAVVNLNKISAQTRNQKQKVTISNRDLEITCTKVDQSPWTLQDLQAAFGDTAYISVNR